MLKKYYVIWLEEEYNSPDTQIFLITIDGVDFKACKNRKHHLYPFDRKKYAFKCNHAGIKYEISID